MNPTQQVRTIQAWSRTTGATAALLIVGVRLAFERGPAIGVLWIAALLPAVAVAVLGRRRAALLRTSPPPPLRERSALLLVVTVLMADVLGAALLIV